MGFCWVGAGWCRGFKYRFCFFFWIFFTCLEKHQFRHKKSKEAKREKEFLPKRTATERKRAENSLFALAYDFISARNNSRIRSAFWEKGLKHAAIFALGRTSLGDRASHGEIEPLQCAPQCSVRIGGPRYLPL